MQKDLTRNGNAIHCFFRDMAYDLTLFLRYKTMQLTRLSSKGQVIIPKSIRDAHRWQAGQELVVLDVEEGLLLKAKKPFKETSVDTVAGCLSAVEKPKSLQDMKAGIRKGLKERWHARGRY